MVLPLGLIAPNCLRPDLLLAAADLPQAPGDHRGADGLDFAGLGWRALTSGRASWRDSGVVRTRATAPG